MKRPRVPLEDTLQTMQKLYAAGRELIALEVLQKTTTHIIGQDAWSRIRQMLEQHPQHHPLWMGLYSKSLTETRDAITLLALTNNVAVHADNSALLLRRAWALTQTTPPNYQQALELLVQLEPHCADTMLGLLYKQRAIAQCVLEQPWQDSIEAAKQQLHGRDLGLCLIDYAWCQQQNNQSAKAYELLLQALPLLRQDPYHLAWARNNLGELAAQTMNPDAERHFKEAESICQKPAAKAQRSRTYQGIGKWRRANHDLTRARSAYQKALRYASEPDDQAAAYWSYGRVLRLQRQPQAALEQLQNALVLAAPHQHHKIRLEQAACWLAMNYLEQSAALLEPTSSEPYNSIYQILKAEHHRRKAQTQECIETLKHIQTALLQTQEELQFWTELQPYTKLEFYPKQPSIHTVHVNACGVLSVHVNHIKASINPTGRVGELLAFLLEQHKQSHIEMIIEHLYPQETNTNKKYRAVHDLIKRLRQVLGWQESVQTHGKIIRLDPQTNWQYDANQKRLERRASAYLEGVRSNWVLEVAQELAALEPILVGERPVN